MTDSGYTTYDALLSCNIYPGFRELPRDLQYLLGCANLDQFCSTLRGILEPEAYCPFCNAQRQQHQLLADGERWCLCENKFPKPGMQMQLIIPKRHLLSVSDMHSSDWVELGHLFGLASARMEGGGLVMRFGDPLYHVGTVPHLHVNIIKPNPDEEHRVALSKDPESHAKNFRRLLAYRDKLVANGGLDWLFSDN